jgi:hypothetical protein
LVVHELPPVGGHDGLRGDNVPDGDGAVVQHQTVQQRENNAGVAAGGRVDLIED